MGAAQYSGQIVAFLKESEDAILGKVFHRENFDSNTRTRDAWIAEIQILKDQLQLIHFTSGSIFFEYTIPRVGGRIDCGLIIDGILYIIEFKTGDSNEVLGQYKEQLSQYVTDLKKFHFESYNTPLVPILLIENLPRNTIRRTLNEKDKTLFEMSIINKHGLSRVIDETRSIHRKSKNVDLETWIRSPYCPTTDIVEAARKLFAGQTVDDIKRSDSEGENLVRTTNRIMEIIHNSKKKREKALCMITGVPGAGKTLIGLSVATQYKNEEKSDGIDTNKSVYLSGNHPLVTVLQEALTRDAVERKKAHLEEKLELISDPTERKAYKRANKVTKESVKSEVKKFIQMIYLWRKEYLQGIIVKNPKSPDAAIIKNEDWYKGEIDHFLPYDHVTIFDEAQRTWNAKEHSDFVRKKSDVPDFPDWSEARFLLSCMDRHQDWAVVVCLIGNGQDINHGEAGIGDWIESVSHFRDWQVYAPTGFQKEIDCTYIKNLHSEQDLHLSVNLRSLRAEKVSEFVDQLLMPDAISAKKTLSQINEQYEIRITRDFAKAKKWLKSKAKEDERYGVIASSKAQRLKPLAIDISHSQTMNVNAWFLNSRKDVHSSYYMEDIATEFQVQGLEIDWACVAWDGDLIYDNGVWDHRQFKVNGWQKINKDYLQKYHINAYRVILTRARRGMIICIPEGDLEDPTRNPEVYDSTYNYLRSIGIQTI